MKGEDCRRLPESRCDESTQLGSADQLVSGVLGCLVGQNES